MKNIFLLITLVLFCIPGNSSISDKNPYNDKVDFDWLIGNWKRTNEKEGLATYESWKKNSPTEYIGICYTLKEKDTVWREHVKLHKTDSVWNYAVTQKNIVPTLFRLIAISNESFTCENKENEFPKKIIYTRKENVINAVISGGDTEIPFVFEKIEPVKKAYTAPLQ